MRELVLALIFTLAISSSCLAQKKNSGEINGPQVQQWDPGPGGYTKDINNTGKHDPGSYKYTKEYQNADQKTRDAVDKKMNTDDSDDEK